MPERLFDHDTGASGQARIVQLPNHRAEQERGDLQVKDWRTGALHGARDTNVSRGILEVTHDIAESGSEAIEHARVELLASSDDGLPRILAKLIDAPIVDGDPDDWTVQQAAPF